MLAGLTLFLLTPRGLTFLLYEHKSFAWEAYESRFGH